jgi:hypothetical protein
VLFPFGESQLRTRTPLRASRTFAMKKNAIRNVASALKLNKETVKDLGVKSGVRAGDNRTYNTCTHCKQN